MNGQFNSPATPLHQSSMDDTIAQLHHRNSSDFPVAQQQRTGGGRMNVRSALEESRLDSPDTSRDNFSERVRPFSMLKKRAGIKRKNRVEGYGGMFILIDKSIIIRECLLVFFRHSICNQINTFERVMLHFKPHPILFYVLST